MKRTVAFILVAIIAILCLGCVKAETYNQCFKVGNFNEVIEIKVDDITSIEYLVSFNFNQRYVKYQCCKQEITVIQESPKEFETIIIYPVTRRVKTLLINEITFTRNSFLYNLKEWDNLRSNGEDYFCIYNNRDAVCSFELLDEIIEHCNE